MQIIKKIGLFIFLIGLAVFTVLPLVGEFKVSTASLDKVLQEKGISSEIFIQEMGEKCGGQQFNGMLSLYQ